MIACRARKSLICLLCQAKACTNACDDAIRLQRWCLESNEMQCCSDLQILRQLPHFLRIPFWVDLSFIQANQQHLSKSMMTYIPTSLDFLKFVTSLTQIEFRCPCGCSILILKSILIAST